MTSIVLHKGDSTNSGHYYSITKNIHDGKWREFDDDTVKPISNIEDKLLENKVMSDSYMLFYVNQNINNESYSSGLEMLQLNDIYNDFHLKFEIILSSENVFVINLFFQHYNLD